MNSTEKFCLKWNDFQENISAAFVNLKETQDFTDVTLVCEDNQQVEAHKIVLSTFSPWFMNLLRRNKQSHPIVYMRGINFNELLSITDYMYHGEVSILQEDLQVFLSLAEELQVKGLLGAISDPDKLPDKKIDNKIVKVAENRKNKNTLIKTKIEHIYPMETSFKEIELYENPTDTNWEVLATDTSVETANITDLDEKINSMIDKKDKGLYSCTSCGKTCKQKQDIHRHVEAMHIEGVEYPCNNCGKTFRSREAIRKHNDRAHRVLGY